MRVRLPNGGIITSYATAELVSSELPIEAKQVHVFNEQDLTEYSLLSVSKLCKAGLHVVFTDSSVTAYDSNHTTRLHGHKDPHTGLYMVQLSAPTGHALTAYPVHNQKQMIEFAVATLGSPTTSTLLKALRRPGFLNFPGLTAAALHRHRTHSLATAKGHLDLTRQGLRSTSRHIEPTETKDLDDAFPIKPTRTNGERPAVYTRCVPLTSQAFGDCAGRFPFESLTGKQYMLIMYMADYNYIHVETMNSRKAHEYIRAYDRALNFFSSHDIFPDILRMDNETSVALETHIKDTRKLNIQYVSPSNHRQNKAERVIRVWKNHFISILSATDPTFPMHAWDELVPQAELTINLLRASNTNPSISAWEHVRGKYDFASTPIGPPGTAVLVYESPDSRASWAPHGVPAFYVGPALMHYRCFKVFVPSTSKTRVTDTLSWHPKTLTLPGDSPIEAVTAAAHDLNKAVQQLAALPNKDMAAMRQPLSDMTQSAASILSELRSTYPSQPPDTPPGLLHHCPDLPPGLFELAPIQRVGSKQQDPAAPGYPATIERVDSIITNGTPTTAPPDVVSNQDIENTERPSATSPTPSDDRLANDEHDSSSRESSSTEKTRLRRTRRQRKKSKTTPRIMSTRIRNKILVDRGQHSHQRPTRTRKANYNTHELPPLHHPVVSGFAGTSITLDPTHGTKLRWRQATRGPDAARWEEAGNAEFDRLHRTRTMRFIPWDEKPQARMASYYNPQLKIKSTGEYRCRGTYGGNISDFEGPKIAETADLATVKILINATISDPQGKFMTADITDFYLGTPLSRPEYMVVRLDQIPQASQDKYILSPSLIRHGCVLAEVTKSIYGLPQAGRLSQQRLIQHLAKHGYEPAPHSPCLFRHRTRQISFVLIVDDFGIRYRNKADAEHLLTALRDLYPLKVNWAGDKFIGYTIRWDRPNNRVHLSMPGYIRKALTRFHVTKPVRPVNAPTRYIPPRYGSGDQTPIQDASPPVNAAATKRIQEIVGVMLYYARALDATHLTAVSKVGSQQSAPTEDVAAAAELLLQYAATWPEAELVYHASDMILHVHSDASYNSEPQARSRVGGYFYLGDHDNPSRVNGAILAISSILPSVVCAASEAEYGGLFKNAQLAAPLRYTLEDVGSPQPGPTPIITDNSVAAGIANDTVTQRRSRATDVKFHWIRDRVRQGQYNVQWKPGHHNLADYFTKTHPVRHFLAMRQFIVHTPGSTITRLTLADLPNPKSTAQGSSTSRNKIKKGELGGLRTAGAGDFGASI